MKTTFDLYYLIGTITIISGFIMYFILSSKKKARKEILPPAPNVTRKHVNQYTVKYLRICGYWFYCDVQTALTKLRALSARKGLQVFNKGGQTFVYLNRKNMIRKMNQFNLQEYVNKKIQQDIPQVT